MQFFQPAVLFILLNGCTTLTLTKRIKKKFDDNCKKKNVTSYIEQILEAISNKTAAARPPTTHFKDHPN